jgi:hypothetical protein
MQGTELQSWIAERAVRLALVVATAAPNKVAGFAIVKVLNGLDLLPIAAFFLRGPCSTWPASSPRTGRCVPSGQPPRASSTSVTSCSVRSPAPLQLLWPRSYSTGRRRVRGQWSARHNTGASRRQFSGPPVRGAIGHSIGAHCHRQRTLPAMVFPC